jgi:rhodanese-related sulfurtransferase
MNEVTVNQLAALADPTVVDVRELFEFTSGHVPGAKNIPLGELTARHLEMPKDQPVYVICQSGGRSVQATQYLEAVGHTAINVTGGTAAWLSAQLPTER